MRSIDIHAHLVPQCFWEATEGTGDRHGDGSGKERRIVLGPNWDSYSPK